MIPETYDLFMINTINLQGGKVTYNEFFIDPNKPFDEQKYDYKEDMLQVKYDDRYLIDVGWYPEFQQQGSFKIVVIDSCDWENPLYKKRTKNLDLALKYIEEAALFIVSLCKKSPDRPIPKCEHNHE